MAATASLLKDLTITKDEGLLWYDSSDNAKRGYCGKCGSPLFWQMKDAPHISITAGSLDDDSGIEFWGHIYSSEKGHYYDLPGGELQCDEKPTNFPVLGQD